MDIQDKTKQELIHELKELQQAYDSLKVSIKTELPESENSEEALQKSRRLLKSMQQAAKIGGWEFDVKTNTQTWTEEIFHILEIDISQGAPDVPEGIGFIAPEYQPMALLGIQRAIEFGESYNLEWQIITSKGNKRWVNAIATPYLENGKTKSVSGSFQDITKRKLAEIALLESEENLSITLKSIGDGVISTDINGLIVNMNPVAEKLCGWALADAFGKPLPEVFQIINAETCETVSNPVEKVLENGQIVGLANHTVLVSKNGAEYQISDSAAPIKNKAGAITGVVLVFSDITGSYIAQKQIKDSEERYRSLLNNLEAGIVVHAPDTSITMNNHRASVLLGLTDDQMRGRVAIDPTWKFIHEDNTPLTIDEYPVNRIVKGMQPIKNQVLGVQQAFKNDIVWLTVNGFPVLDTKGGITEIVISFIDITERKQAGEKQKESELTFRKLFEDSADAILLIDSKGVFSECNQAALDLLQMPREQFLLMTPVKTSPEFQPNGRKSKEAAIEMIDLAYKNGLHRFEWTHINTKGEEFIVEVSLMPIAVKGQTMLHTTWRDITKRKQDEEALTLTRLSIDSASDSLYWMKHNGRIVDVNEAACRLLGYTREEILQLSVQDVDAHYNADVWAQHFPELRKFGTLKFESEQRAKDGRLIPVEIVANYVQRGDEEFNCAFVRDITERKQAEKELKESEERFKSMFERHSSIMLLVNPDTGRIVNANDASTRFYGYSKPELLSMCIEQINTLPPEQVKMERTQALREERSDFIFPHKLANGEVRTVEVHSTPISFQEQKILFSIIHDITKRKLAEVALSKSEYEFRLLAESMPQIVWITRPDGWNIFFNEQWVNYTGLTLEESYGHGWNKPFHPDDQQRAWEAWQNATTNLDTYSIECRLRRFDGEYKWWLIRGVPVFDELGVLIKWFGTCTDIDEIKCSEAELLSTKEKYRLAEIDLLEAQKLANIGSWHWDIKTGVVTWSAELYNINGHNPDIPVPAFADMESYYTAESWKVLNEAVAKTINTGEPYNIDCEMVKPDGTVIYTNTRGCAYFDEAGEMINLHGTVQDITERKRLEDVHTFLSTSGYQSSDENFFESLAKYLSEILDSEYVCIDKLKGDGLTAQTVAIYNEGKFDANDSYTLKETPCGDVVGKTICCFPENVCQLFPHDEALRELKAHSYIGTTLWSFDGKPIGLIAIIGQKPLKDAAFAENVLKLVAIRAATELERIQAEEKLRESEAIKDAMVSNIGDVIVIIDQNGINQYKSPNITTLFGWKPEELIGKSTWDNVHPDDLQAAKEFIATLATEPNATDTTEIRYQRKDGRYVWIEITVVNLLSDPYIRGFLGNYHEITERKLVEEELTAAKEKAEESDRLKSSFLANMSHEIRTPMNGILGFADLLKKPDLTGEEQQSYIKIIEKSGARMLNIINDIVDISKIEAGLMKIDLKESNVNEQTEYIYTFFKPEAEAKGIQFSFRNTLPHKEAIIHTDREKLYAILTNLIKNAVKYTKAGSIEFGYDVVATNLRFYVKDTGIGIPTDRQEAIFERFIQADIADLRAQQGAGLGLAISKAYVEMLGGTIGVESEVGKGSVFYFTLPYNNKPVKETPDQQSAPSVKIDTTRKLKILIAEDDDVSEILISLHIAEISREIIKVGNGLDAVEICRQNPDIDLILMDIQLPALNGDEATRQIRQFNKDVIIIAQTAYGLSGDREKALAAGCSNYIAKPINKVELLSLIQEYFI